MSGSMFEMPRVPNSKPEELRARKSKRLAHSCGLPSIACQVDLRSTRRSRHRSTKSLRVNRNAAFDRNSANNKKVEYPALDSREQTRPQAPTDALIEELSTRVGQMTLDMTASATGANVADLLGDVESPGGAVATASESFGVQTSAEQAREISSLKAEIAEEMYKISCSKAQILRDQLRQTEVLAEIRAIRRERKKDQQEKDKALEIVLDFDLPYKFVRQIELRFASPNSSKSSNDKFQKTLI